MIRVAAVGECMLELTHLDAGSLALGFSGDTYNTAVYLARSTASADVQVAYLTLVGDDWYSDQMLAAMAAEGLDATLVRRAPHRSPGLYLIRTDPDGERSFTYHRSASPARELFGPDRPVTLAGFDLVYLSAITLQIITEEARARLWRELDEVRDRGGRVVFDGNFRPAGWPDAATARAAIAETLRRTDIALPTMDDERALFGDPDAEACVHRLRAYGVGEIVVKEGADGCVVAAAGASPVRVPAESGVRVVDTTAAGDSFNAGYLAARLSGAEPRRAARAAHRLAATVIGHRGAIVADSVVSRRG